jgi:hypothetical protein
LAPASAAPPVGCPNSPPDGVPDAEEGAACFAVPNIPPADPWPPNKLLVVCGAELLPVGGGPAGVVEFPKLNCLDGAGVERPAGAEVVVASPPPNKPPDAAG